MTSIQAMGTDGEPSVATLPQYRPAFDPPSTYEGQGASVAIAPLRHNGDVLNVHINGTPTHVWSDGHVEVWADDNPNRVTIPPGHRIHFPGHRTVLAVPKSGDAYTLFSQASGGPRKQRPIQLPVIPAIFPYGSIVPCPQVSIGNGMARCQ